MNWSDIKEIALALHTAHPEIDPMSLRFTRLRAMILALDGFDTEAGGCHERVLEAIQMAWLDEHRP